MKVGARRYLDQPFEVAFERDLFGDASRPQKIVASKPMDVSQTASWDQLVKAPEGVLILNGDSSHFPLPDTSIDAIVTDPPCFDFVHYSELSDFFFAWLSPVLKNRYDWFDKDDSSDPAEVQHKDARIFARLLASVFSECRRVLKDAGVLAFSFHHSREEGWAAIYDAVTTAGFDVVAAHPVHAELRGSNPKSAASDPISLDAILVGRKHAESGPSRFDIDAVLRMTEQWSLSLSSAGIVLSEADHFVIAASQTLISASCESLSFESITARLRAVREHLSNFRIG